MSLRVHNNTVYASGTCSGGLAAVNNISTCTVENNVVTANAFTAIGFDLVADCANNCSSDGSADDYGGTGHQVNKTAAQCFHTPGTNFAPKAAGPLQDTGKTVAAVTADIAGVARPQGSAYDIGAVEYVAPASGPGRKALLLTGVG